MLGKFGRHVRGHMVGYLALFIALGGTSYAAGDAISGSSGPQIYACVTRAYSTMNLAGPHHTCPSGQQLIRWNEKGRPGVPGIHGAQGPAGKAGARGAAGARGSTGATGARGDAGATGAIGATGATGPRGDAGAAGAAGSAGPAGPAGARGDTGPAGLIGAPGPAGPAGDRGDRGDTGDRGATGDPGPAGAGPMLLASAPSSLQTVLGGAGNTNGYLPLSGSLTQANDSNASDGGSAATLVSQSIPRASTLTGLTASFTTTSALSLVGSTIVLTAEVDLGDPGSAPTSVVSCNATPALTGVLAPGVISTCTVSGLDIPVDVAESGWIRVSATVVAGLDVAATIPVDVSVGTALN